MRQATVSLDTQKHTSEESGAVRPCDSDSPLHPLALAPGLCVPTATVVLVRVRRITRGAAQHEVRNVARVPNAATYLIFNVAIGNRKMINVPPASRLSLKLAPTVMTHTFTGVPDSVFDVLCPLWAHHCVLIAYAQNAHMCQAAHGHHCIFLVTSQESRWFTLSS